MKVCIEQVEGGFSVYQDVTAEAPATQPTGTPAGMDMAKDQGQTVATVDKALQIAGSMLGGGESGQPGAEASAEQDAQALFESGFGQARMPR